jgi:hypothetical protein
MLDSAFINVFDEKLTTISYLSAPASRSALAEKFAPRKQLKAIDAVNAVWIISENGAIYISHCYSIESTELE